MDVTQPATLCAADATSHLAASPAAMGTAQSSRGHVLVTAGVVAFATATVENTETAANRAAHTVVGFASTTPAVCDALATTDDVLGAARSRASRATAVCWASTSTSRLALTTVFTALAGAVLGRRVGRVEAAVHVVVIVVGVSVRLGIGRVRDRVIGRDCTMVELIPRLRWRIGGHLQCAARESAAGLLGAHRAWIC